MPRIEIPLSEYDGLKEKIKELEERVVEMSNEAALYKETCDKAESLIYDIASEGIFNRLFKWNKTISPLFELFSPKKV